MVEIPAFSYKSFARVSDRPLKDGIPFCSPETMAVTFTLPHKGKIRGMGIKKGITLIVGGGYHGKSFLIIKALFDAYRNKLE